MRTKIDYGIDLGTTNSAIARMQNGEAKIIKSDFQEDTLPSCVNFNKKQTILAGKSAYTTYKSERLKALRNFEEEASNTFLEFKRTMGTDTKYYSSNMDKTFNSEELSAEILKKLKSLVTDENIKSIVITVPAKFTINQNDATVRAAKLAGLQHIELLQEPIAASMAYGLKAENKDGYWLVFDFGGGTFDAALLKVDEGIMKVIDTEGDNYLGGKNLDEAIVDGIILPYLEENFAIDSILGDADKKEILRGAMKFYAEDAKNQLSFSDSHNVLSELGDIPGEDDAGKEFELDINISQSDLEKVFEPIFQKAITLCKNLISRNNLSGSQLAALILVGGPTYSPILRRMLNEQVTDKVDTSCDPMTAVAKGASLYASTLNVSEEIVEASRDKTKIQLYIGNEPTTVEMDEWVTLKILKDKTQGKLPAKVFAEITRGDKAWSSGKKEINDKGEIIEVALNARTSNSFDVTLYDEDGNKLDCQPDKFTILQGIKEAEAVLSYHIGIEVYDDFVKKDVFMRIPGLQRNLKMPATGVTAGLKTQKQIRPGMVSDYFIVPIYQGEEGADGIRAIYNDHVYDVKISGENLPALLPANSDVEITLKGDRSGQIQFSAFFPYLGFTEELVVDRNKVKESKDASEIKIQIQNAKKALDRTKNSNNSSEVEKVKNNLTELEIQLEQGQSSDDRRFQVLNNLRKEMKIIDEIENEAELPKLLQELKNEFYDLEALVKKVKDLGDDEEMDMAKIEEHTAELKAQIEQAIKAKDKKVIQELIRKIGSLDFALRDALAGVQMDINLLQSLDSEFNSTNWTNANRARDLINRGLQMANNNPSKQALRQLVIQVLDLRQDTDATSDRLKRGR
jgi:molecular chaperone DnaK